MIGIPNKDSHLAFIYTKHLRSKFISLWFDEIHHRARVYNILLHIKFLRKWFKKTWRRCDNWDYFGNAIITPLIQSLSQNDIMVIDRDNMGAFPEYLSSLNIAGIDKVKLYREFYFDSDNKGDEDHILQQTNGIIMFHNSWTPEKFKLLSEEAFLNTNVPLARILRKLLYL